MATDLDPKQQLSNWQQRINALLPKCLDGKSADDHLKQAMQYSLEGGKRIRPLLAYATGHALDIELSTLDRYACAVEMMHVYSLIHDDLPAMDDDDLRRGRPSCHKAFDEATAILAGNALQLLSIEQLFNTSETTDRRLKQIKMLCHASGSNGLASGQSLDIQSEHHSPSKQALEKLYRLKTGALIVASVTLPALHCPQYLTQFETFANNIGLAFQIKDDLLDLESSTETLGKPAHSDLKHEKATYPSLFGHEQAKQKLEQLHQQAITALDEMALDQTKMAPLLALCQQLLGRRY